jgi:hypothetical protein
LFSEYEFSYYSGLNGESMKGRELWILARESGDDEKGKSCISYTVKSENGGNSIDQFTSEIEAGARILKMFQTKMDGRNTKMEAALKMF